MDANRKVFTKRSFITFHRLLLLYYFSAFSLFIFHRTILKFFGMLSEICIRTCSDKE